MKDEVAKYVNKGVERSKVAYVGSLAYEQMFLLKQGARNKRQTLIAKFYSKENENENEHLIICALPHLYEHGLLPKKQHWKVQMEICEQLKLSNAQVLLSLHPKSKIKKLRLNSFWVQVVEKELQSVLPAASIFIAGNSSTTIEWAIEMGIPAFALNWYRMHYERNKKNPAFRLLMKERHYPKS